MQSKSSPRVLLYYFDPRTPDCQSLARVLEHQRSRSAPCAMAKHNRHSDACRAILKQLSAPQSDRCFKFFFETLWRWGGCGISPKFADFLSNAVGDLAGVCCAPLVSKASLKRPRLRPPSSLSDFPRFHARLLRHATTVSARTRRRSLARSLYAITQKTPSLQ